MRRRREVQRDSLEKITREVLEEVRSKAAPSVPRTEQRPVVERRPQKLQSFKEKREKNKEAMK